MPRTCHEVVLLKSWTRGNETCEEDLRSLSSASQHVAPPWLLRPDYSYSEAMSSNARKSPIPYDLPRSQ
jgi:hypothetical protein